MTYPVSILILAQVRAELIAYQPGSAATVIKTEEFLARRQQLWRRLDWWIANGEKAA